MSVTLSSRAESTVDQDWFFTFGSGHGNSPKHGPLCNCCVKVHGTYASARQAIIQHYGHRWAFQYESAEKAGVAEWKYTVIGIGE